MSRKAKILVVDDSEVIRTHFAAILAREGHEVWEAGDGEKGLSIAREVTPDLVLLDVIMPGMNGFEVCQALKADKTLPGIFVVLVSGRTTDETPESWGLNTGADDYIVKPVPAHEFLARVNFILRLRDTTVELRSALQLNEAMMEASAAAIQAYRADGPCVFANQAAAVIAHTSIAEVRKGNFRKLRYWRESGLLALAESTLQTQEVTRQEVHIEWKLNREAWLDCQLNCFSSGGEPHLLLIAHEITERKRLEAELRALHGKVIAAQESERQRVARELHDGVNQLIASAKMRLRRVAEKSANRLDPADREILARCDRMMVNALEENRRIAHNLRPSELDELGLSEACRSLCNQFALRTGLEVVNGVNASKRRFPRDLELNIFRVLQEALTNIEKHAEAKRVWVRLAFAPGSIVLCVLDDGKGFQGSGVHRPTEGGVGLGNMRERAAAMGAKYEVVSTPGKGTSISLVVPLGSGGATPKDKVSSGRSQPSRRRSATEPEHPQG